MTIGRDVILKGYLGYSTESVCHLHAFREL